MDAGKALLEVEAALEAAGKLRPEWQLQWQAAWRARLAHCYDMRDALMCAAALEVSSRLRVVVCSEPLTSALLSICWPDRSAVVQLCFAELMLYRSSICAVFQA